MRATRRITWLLLSLSYLCHGVSSDGLAAVMSAPTILPSAAAKSGTESSTDSKTTVPAGSVTGTTPTDAEKKTPAPTTVKPSTAASTPAPTVAAALKPTDKPTPTQPKASTAASSSPAPPTSSPHTPHTPATAVDSSTPAAAVSTATSGSSGVSVAVPSATTLQTPGASVPFKTPGTVTPSRPAAGRGSEGTTRITKVSTDAPTPGHQSMTLTTTNSKTSQEVSKGGTEVTHVTAPSPGQTASKAPQPAGNTGTMSTPFTPTKAGPPASETSGNNAGNVSPQATVASTAYTTYTTTTTTTTTTAAQPRTFLYSLNRGQEKEEEKELAEVCRRLMVNLHDGNCTLTWRHHNGKLQFDHVEINGKVKTSLAKQYYEEITKKPTDNKTLIAILASCGALLIMIVILAVCASHHRRPYNENQQHLTEELHTVENGYHDNPTLEVMEVQPEMQEKKMALNGEFNDSWIVPIDNLLKEDIPDEEDTHL